MDATVIVGTFGAEQWRSLAKSRAMPSAAAQAPVIHIHGRTLADARNEGAATATSEWLCFLDADDELAPGYMAAMAAVEGDLRGPAVQYIRRGVAEPPMLWPASDLAERNYLLIGTLIRRDLFLELDGFREYPLYEDWDLWTRASLAGASVVQVPGAVYIAHVSRGSRNTPPYAEQLRWYHEIRRANFPELYPAAVAA